MRRAWIAVTALLVAASGSTRSGATSAQDSGGRNQAASASPLTLMERVGTYVQRFETEFSNVVSEEHYEQSVLRSGRSFANTSQPLRRDMVSEFLLVRLPEPIGWAPFRDVFEVDKRPIRDRESRLMKLFTNSSAASTRRAIEITADSARYNIGVPRTMNQPVLALQVLRLTEQYRFEFSTPKADASAGAGVVSFTFKEHERPSLFSGPAGSEMPVHGRMWVNDTDGTVIRTELLMDTLAVRASIVTQYEADASFHLAVPVEMREDYAQTNGPRLIARATYGRFRSFNVEVTDRPMLQTR